MSLHTVLFHSFLVGVVWWEKRGCTIDVHILVLSIWVWLMKESQRCWLTAENHRGFAVVQLLSHVQLFVTPWIAECQAFLSFTISWSLLKLISIESVMPFSHLIFCNLLPSSFPASGSFPMNQLFASGDQSIGASALASVIPMNIQGWFPLGFTGLISLLSKGLLRVFSSKLKVSKCALRVQGSIFNPLDRD